MKALLVVLAYIHSGGVGGGISVEVETKELPNIQVCQQAGEALKEMGGKMISFRCIEYSN